MIGPFRSHCRHGLAASCVAVAAFLLAISSEAMADDPVEIVLALHPARIDPFAASPRLLPADPDLKPGNAAVVLNGARIGKNCVIGAGSVVTEGKEFPDGSLIMGTPAKVVRELTPEQIEGLRNSAKHYMNNALRFKNGLKKIA